MKLKENNSIFTPNEFNNVLDVDVINYRKRYQSSLDMYV